MANGQLVEMAEASGFELLITTDKNLRYQQNLTGRRIAIMVLWTTNWPEIRPHTDAVAQAAIRLAPDRFLEFARPA